jgi:hypothetical protein
MMHGSAMNLRCPTCRAALDPADVNLDAKFAVCPVCVEIFKITQIATRGPREHPVMGAIGAPVKIRCPACRAAPKAGDIDAAEGTANCVRCRAPFDLEVLLAGSAPAAQAAVRQPASTRIIIEGRGTERLSIRIPAYGWCKGTFGRTILLAGVPAAVAIFAVILFGVPHGAAPGDPNGPPHADGMPGIIKWLDSIMPWFVAAGFMAVALTGMALTLWELFVRTEISMDEREFTLRRIMFGIRFTFSTEIKTIAEIRVTGALPRFWAFSSKYMRVNKEGRGIGATVASTANTEEAVAIRRGIHGFPVMGIGVFDRTKTFPLVFGGWFKDEERAWVAYELNEYWREKGRGTRREVTTKTQMAQRI